MKELAINSIVYSFLSPIDKEKQLAKLKEKFEAFEKEVLD
jgi:hypothetical protein